MREEGTVVGGPRKGLALTPALCRRLLRRRRKKITRMTKVSSPRPPIIPPMIDPRLIEWFFKSKDALEVPLTLEVLDDEPAGITRDVVWEGRIVVNAVVCPEEDDASF